jgi:hypothetical protein
LEKNCSKEKKSTHAPSHRQDIYAFLHYFFSVGFQRLFEIVVESSFVKRTRAREISVVTGVTPSIDALARGLFRGATIPSRRDGLRVPFYAFHVTGG